MASGTIAQPALAMLGNANFRTLRQASTTTSDTFTVASGSRHILILSDTRSDMCGIYSIAAYSGGGVICAALTTTQTAITVDNSVSNRLTLTHASRQIMYFAIALSSEPLALT